jgi:hypothetical protein
VCSSLDAKGKNTTIFNNIICEVFELEHPPLASKIEEHTCIMRRVKESGGERERGLKYDIMKSELKYAFYKFTSWIKCPVRGMLHGTKSNVYSCVAIFLLCQVNVIIKKCFIIQYLTGALFVAMEIRRCSFKNVI